MKYQKDALSTFPSQIQSRINAYEPHGLTWTEFSNVVICGLGGSGIGGRIAKNIFRDLSELPIEVNSHYILPKYVNSDSLVIMCSYSGNTEETLTMLMEAQNRQCSIVALTSAGELLKISKENNYPIYLSKQGCQPRMALGYSLTNLLLVLSEFFNLSLQEQLSEASQALRETESFIQKGNKIFKQIDSPTEKHIIIADDQLEPLATRFAQQIQENAKEEAFVNVLPEANHNVLETYHQGRDGTYYLLISGENHRVNLRFEFLKQLFTEKGIHFIEIPFEQNNLQSWFETIYVLDWVSLWLADSLSRESESVPIITELKEYLANHN